MIEETKTTETQEQRSDVATPKVDTAAPDTAARKSAGNATARPRRDNQRGGRDQRPRRNRKFVRKEDRREFDQKIISIRRVTRVVAGGRRFSFSVAMVIGDHKGKVGVGVGKAGDTALAIEKASRDAKKHMIVIPTTKEGTIRHDVAAKYCASRVMIQPAPGRGIVAGSSVRNVLELAGVKDVTAKIFSRSKNRLNNAQAAIEALQQLGK